MYFDPYFSLFQEHFAYYLILFTSFLVTKLLQFQRCRCSSLRSQLILFIYFFSEFTLNLVHDLRASSLHEGKNHRIYWDRDCER